MRTAARRRPICCRWWFSDGTSSANTMRIEKTYLSSTDVTFFVSSAWSQWTEPTTTTQHLPFAHSSLLLAFSPWFRTKANYKRKLSCNINLFTSLYYLAFFVVIAFAICCDIDHAHIVSVRNVAFSRHGMDETIRVFDENFHHFSFFIFPSVVLNTVIFIRHTQCTRLQYYWKFQKLRWFLAHEKREENIQPRMTEERNHGITRVTFIFGSEKS